MGGPWDETFEPKFDAADGAFTTLVPWLGSLDTGSEKPSDELRHRFLPQNLPPNQNHNLAICIASLVARSPLTRERIRHSIESFHNKHAIKGYKAPDHLIGMNRRNLFEGYARRIETGGKFIVLLSDSREFIFGDGFLNNFPLDPMCHSATKCVIPMTPGISVIYVRPISYRIMPRVLTIRLSDREVNFFNDLVQVYSAREIFYRAMKPDLTSSFDGEHRQYLYHRNDFLDSFIDEALGERSFSVREEPWLERILGDDPDGAAAA
jgi:hypothetical protein